MEIVMLIQAEYIKLYKIHPKTSGLQRKGDNLKGEKCKIKIYKKSRV